MSTEDVLQFAAALVLAALVTLVLASIAPRLAIVDDGSDAPERKPQRRSVPLVGGLAIAAVLFVAWSDGAHSRSGFADRYLPLLSALTSVRAGYGACALLGALALGLADDVAARGLRPLVKLAGQIAVAVLCALHALELRTHEPGSSAAWSAALVAFVLALLAMNAFNTFDNADGAATSLAALALGAVVPVLAAPLLGFLPFNLWVRRRSTGGSSTPLAYLGDAGSHLLGVLVALVPGAWPALALPLLDLARLSVVRVRSGSRPWIGDRRHLAHRLQARGLGPTAVVLVLLVLAAPPVVAAAVTDSAWVVGGAAALTALGVLAVVRRTPTPD